MNDTPLTRTEDLKMFIFSLSSTVKTTAPNYKSGYVAIAFTLDEAIAQFQKDHIDKPNVVAESLGNITITKLQTLIPDKPEKASPLNMIEAPTEIPKDTKDQFIVNLRLAADKFMEEGKDKSSLLKIIDRMSV